MAIKAPLNIVLGAANIGDKSKDPMARFDSPEEVTAFLEAYHKRGGRQVDTARLYSPHAPGSSEHRLGIAEAGKTFAIDTKVFSLAPGSHTKEKIEENLKESLSELKIPQINIEYLHSPDRTTPFEETLEAVDKAYKQGKFKQFGLSNYTAEEVEKILQICEEKGWVKPTVYQGQYNPIVRSGEKELLPLLRKHNMAFYAWSPAAAGFFAGNYKNVQAGSHWDSSTFIGNLYKSAYQKPAIEAAADRAIALVSKHGINGHGAALRRTTYHSQLDPQYGDAVIVGASSVAQLISNLDMIEEGPLPEEVVKAMNAVHEEAVGHEMPYHM